MIFLWLFLALLFFVLPWTWGARAWGAPWPYYVRRRRDGYVRPARPDRWWIWADLLWLLWVVLLFWLLLGVL